MPEHLCWRIFAKIAIFSQKNLIVEIRQDSKYASKYTAQKMKFSFKDFFSKCGQIRRKLRIWSHLLKKFLMENFIFYYEKYGNFT